MFFADYLKNNNSTMRKTIILLLVLALTTLLTYAQQQSAKPLDGKARIEQQIKHYTTLFALNEAEAEQFDAMYKAYNKKLFSLYTRYQKEQDDEILSDEELEERILANFALSREILNIREEYYNKFRTILSPSQINTIFEDEKSRRNKVRANSR